MNDFGVEKTFLVFFSFYTVEEELELCVRTLDVGMG
jgi:hypothetical protein